MKRYSSKYFYKADKYFLSAKYYIKGDKHISITPAHKLVYLHMKDQYDSYSKMGKPYFEEQKHIGLSVGLSESAVKLATKALVDMGLVVIKKVKGTNHKQNHYTVKSPHNISTTFHNPELDEVIDRKRKHQEQQVQPLQQYQVPEDDTNEDQIPF